MTLPATPSQTAGPFFHIGLSWLTRTELFGPEVRGERVTVAGRVLDGAGEPVDDAVLEIWQADGEGRFAGRAGPNGAPAAPGLQGFGRIPTGQDGGFRFTTVIPGAVPGPGGRPQAPHLLVAIFMRGLLRALVTRLYFPGQAASADDPVLARVDPARRATLFAGRSEADPSLLTWNVHLQGEHETVFFDC